MMLFLLGLYKQLYNQFFFFSSIYRFSIGLDSVGKNLTGISSLMNTIIPSPCWSRSRRKTELYPGTLNWPIGKDLVSLVSEVTGTMTFPFICSTSRSNLFLTTFILRCPIAMFWRFFLQISFRLVLYEFLDSLLKFSNLYNH